MVPVGIMRPIAVTFVPLTSAITCRLDFRWSSRSPT